jgi:mannose/fructose/N-acetylgalactosamine-specific phosphotransferase system component IID
MGKLYFVFIIRVITIVFNRTLVKNGHKAGDNAILKMKGK